MSRPVAVLRPEPGNGQTAARLAERGLAAIRLPLFEVAPLAWQAPDPGGFDALILTSANTLRHGGGGLGTLAGLAVFAVGEATAAAARAQGFDVVAVGAGNAADLIESAAAAGIKRALHLGGREAMLSEGGVVARAIAVYASDAVAIPAVRIGALAGAVAMLHSARAAARLAMLADGAGLARSEVRLAAIGDAVAAAAGPGWATVAIAARPSDIALIDAAARLTD